MVLPFSVFYRSDRNTYYVAFKNEETGQYLPAISTKKDKQDDAIKQAFTWYRESIPHRKSAIELKTYSLRDSIHRAEISQNGIELNLK